MKEQKIVIEIDKEGRIRADADGFSGDACLKELDRLLEGLALPVASVDRKPGAGAGTLGTVQTQTVGKKR